MVLSLASLIPAPQADRKDPISADGASRRSARADQRSSDQARFGVMIEPARPLPQQASPRATEAHSGSARSERPPHEQPSRPDPLRDRPHDTRPERADPLRDDPRRVDANDQPKRSTPLEDRPAKAGERTERVVYESTSAKEQAKTTQTSEHRETAEAGLGEVGSSETLEKTDSATAASELNGQPTAAMDGAGQSSTDLLTDALAALAQHLAAQSEVAKTDAGTSVAVEVAASASTTAPSGQAVGQLDASALQIATGLPVAPAATPATAGSPGTTETTAPSIAQAQAASPQAAILAALAAEVDGGGGEAKNAEAGVVGDGSATVPAASAIPAATKAALPTPDFVAMIGSDVAKAAGSIEGKADVKAAPAVASPASGAAKGQVGEMVQPPVKSVPDTGPKAVFAEWMQDFAAAHGATHRSGDLMSSLDRLANGLPLQTGSQDVLRPTPLQMLPVEIGMQAMRGVTRFQIRLDPAELGRVDVKLEIRETGEVEASLVVDRVETLALLKRDANTLHQAFEQAGLKQSPDGLQFSLRGEGQKGEGQQGREDQRPRWPGQENDEALPVQNQIAEIAMRRMMIPNSSIDRII